MSTLGEVRLDRSRGINPSKLPAQMFELYSVPSFSEGQPEIVTNQSVGSHKRTVEKNAVLLCKINPRINRVWVVGDFSEHQKIASTEWLGFFEVDGLYPNYLCHYLRQDAFRDYLATNASGVGGSLMRVRPTTFADYPLLLPPLAEQHRIVAEIEKHLTRLDAAVAALRRARANLKRYRAGVLKAACAGKLVPTEAELACAEGRHYEPAGRLLQRILTEHRARWQSDDKRRRNYKEPAAPDTSELPDLQEGWVWATVEQLASLEPNSITDGPFGSNLKTSHYTEDGPRVIRLQNIGEGRFIDAEAHISWEHYRTLARHRVQPGDLVIAALGDTLPRSCLIPFTVGPAIVKADCIRFKPAEHIALAEYLNIALNADQTRRRTAGIVHGVGRPRLNSREIKGISLPLPALAEQRRIVAEVERRLSVIQQTEAAVEASLKRAGRLRQSILKQAFSGRLVPQDPNDEPASVLLDRIRAQRAAAQATRTNKRRPRRRVPAPSGSEPMRERKPTPSPSGRGLG